jgi:hypothetical protein
MRKRDGDIPFITAHNSVENRLINAMDSQIKQFKETHGASN